MYYEVDTVSASSRSLERTSVENLKLWPQSQLHIRTNMFCPRADSEKIGLRNPWLLEVSALNKAYVSLYHFAGSEISNGDHAVLGLARAVLAESLLAANLA